MDHSDPLDASAAPPQAPAPAAPERGRRAVQAPLPPDVVEAQKLASNNCGDYVLVERVGLGGYGVVYRAWQRTLQRWVALKFLHVGGATELERFEREARLAAQLSHPAIVPVYEVGEYEGRAFLTMQFIDGNTLDGARVEPERAALLIAEVAEAVAHAHERGIIHRDLKPGNIMVSESGHVYVMDFGLARALDGESRLTRTGVVAGTPAYMSPEQATGESCDARSDIYSLGATLYELLTRHTPFEGQTPVAVLAQVVATEPMTVRRLNPQVSRELDAIVGKAMQKRPAHRYDNAAAFAADIRRALRGEPILARRESMLSRGWKWMGRHRLATAFMLVAMLAAASLVAGSLYHAASMSQARAHAEEKRLDAEQKLARSLMAEADALAMSSRWADAQRRYVDAQEVFERLGKSTLPAQLGMMAVLEAAKPALQVYEGHTGLVTAVAFTPDDKHLLSASDDGTARVWDVITGRPLRVLTGHEVGVWSAACSPDGRLHATGAQDGTVRLWDAETGALVRTIAAAKRRVGALAFSPDGKFLWSGSEDKELCQWDVATGALVRAFRKLGGRVRGIELSPDGARVATAGGDRRARVWNVASGALLHEIETGRGLFSVRFAEQGTHLMLSGEDGEATMWRLSDGAMVRALGHHSGVVSALKVTHGGRYLVTSSWDGRTRIMSFPALAAVRVLHDGGERVLAMDVSNDGRFVVEARADGQLQLVELFAPEGARTNQDVRADFSPDGRLAFTWDQSAQRALIWDVHTRLLLRSRGFGAFITHAAFSPAGRFIVVGTQDNQVHLWDLLEDAVAWRCPTAREPMGSVFSADGKRLWVAQRGALGVYDVAGCEAVAPLSSKLPTWAFHVTTSPDESVVAVGGSATKTGVLLADPQTGNVRQALDMMGTPGLDVSFFPDGKRLVSAGALGTVTVVEAATGKPVRTFRGPPAPVFSVAPSPDGRLLATGAGDGTVRLWDAMSGNEVRALPPLPARVTRVRFTNNGRLLAGSGDGSFQSWDFSSPQRFTAQAPALAKARRALAQDRAAPADWATLADWLAGRGICPEAVTMYERADALGEAVDPLSFGRCLWAAGRMREARAMLERARATGLAEPSYVELLLAAPRSAVQAP